MITEPRNTLEVARAKINQALEHFIGGNTQDMVLVEDAGLFVSALNGFPGVYSSYVLDTLVQRILRLLEHLNSEDTVQCPTSCCRISNCCSWMNGEICRQRQLPRLIAHKVPKEKDLDLTHLTSDLDDLESLFHPQYGVKSTHGNTFGAIPMEEKQAYSHRSRALDDLLRQLPSA